LKQTKNGVEVEDKEQSLTWPQPFFLVMDNLQKIRAIDENYYLERILFFITYSKDLPLDNLYNFFLTDDRVNQNTLRFSYVNSLDTDYYEKYPYKKEEQIHQLDAIIEAICEKKSRKETLVPIEAELFTQVTDFFKKLSNKKLSSLANSCIFNNRLYVDSDGLFHICEKMNNRFPIGDYQKGFDIPRMVSIIQEFMDLVKQHCADCDARFLCNRCYIHFAKDGRFSINPEFCEINKKSIKKLEKIIRLKEKGVF